jgi:hypothetical protein
MSFYSDEITYSALRTELETLNWGDVYTFGDGFWYVKLVGSALLPVGFFAALIYVKGRKKIIYSAILFLACVVSNTAFLLVSIAFFLIYMCVKFKIKKTVLLVNLLFLVVIFLSFMLFMEWNTSILNNKEDSLGVRSEQLNILFESFHGSFWSAIFGSGLGNRVIHFGQYRNYIGDGYFELQSVYFLSQLGYVGFGFFSILSCYFFIKSVKLNLVKISLMLYLVYASTNPYIFDTTHFVVLILLTSIDQRIRDDKN